MHNKRPVGTANCFTKRGQWGVLALLALLCGLFAQNMEAQTTGTNTVTLVADNITNANTVLTPIVIGVSIIFIIWAFIKKVGKKAG